MKSYYDLPLSEPLGQLSPAQHEQEGQMLFVRWFNPTEMDKAVRAVMTEIKRYNFPGWDIMADFNLMGFEGGPVYDFLEAYIGVANPKGYAVTVDNREEFQQALEASSDIRPENIAIYIDAVLDAQAAGTLPPTIYAPYTYDPTSAPEAGEQIAPAIVGTVNRALILGAIVLTAYIAGPPIIAAIGRATGKRRRASTEPSLASP